MQIDSNLLLTIALFGLAVLSFRYLPRLLAGVPFVPANELKGRLDAGEDVVVIDVRTAGEFAGGRIPGAINLPLGEVAMRLRSLGPELDAYKTQPVYAICRTENRAASAVRTFKKAGFTDLKVVAGGMGAWRRLKFPVET